MQKVPYGGILRSLTGLLTRISFGVLVLKFGGVMISPPLEPELINSFFLEESMSEITSLSLGRFTPVKFIPFTFSLVFSIFHLEPIFTRGFTGLTSN